MQRAVLLPDLIQYAWYKDTGVAFLFTHILSSFDSKGEVAVSVSELVKQTGLSVKIVRTALKKLEIEKLILVKSTFKNSIITVVDFDNYVAKTEPQKKSRAKKDKIEPIKFSNDYIQPIEIGGIEYDKNHLYEYLQTESTTEEPKQEQVNKLQDAIEKAYEQSTYTKCMDLYHNFIIKQTNLKPHITSHTGKALKEIIEQLGKNEKVQIHNGGIELAFDAILQNYPKWDRFQQKQIKLNQISHNLLNIITTIKAYGNTINNERADNFDKVQEELRMRRAIRDNGEIVGD